MSKIELPNTYENYAFEYIGDNVYYHIRIHTFRELLYADVYANSELICAGVRCVMNQWLIPFLDKRVSGNFKFMSNDSEYPETGNLGKSCNLYFFGKDEL